MKVLYFAWLRERIGHSEEEVELPDDVRTVRDLVHHLKERGAGYVAAFAQIEAIKVAINQDFSKLDDAISNQDEIAFFPPVTGG